MKNLTNYQCNRCWHVHEKTSKSCDCECHNCDASGTAATPFFLTYPPDATGEVDTMCGVNYITT